MARLAAALLIAAALARAHGGHGDDPHRHDPDHLVNDPDVSYAERHMRAEHHIDSFDLPSFFNLHDLDRNGFWDPREIAAVYGLLHETVLKGNPLEKKIPEGLQEKVVKGVLSKLDQDGDGRISLLEFVAGGKDGLPKFDDDFKDLGHHYDEESEYFLHHEELYHSTPETQTDESYTHPEDIEHFRHHAQIEDEEDARERRYQGLHESADLAADHKAPVDPLAVHEHAPGEGPDDVPDAAPDAVPDAGGVEDPAASGATGAGSGRKDISSEELQRLRAQRAANPNRGPPRRLQSEGGSGKRHRHNPEERSRKDAPYKYKMRQGLRSDEF